MKNIILIALVLNSCTASPTNHEAVARDVFTAFNEHDWAKMESLYSDSVEMMDPSFEGIKIGKEGMTGFYKSVPDIHDEIKTLTASGNTVVVEFVSTGTIEGNRFELPICTVFKIENGKVISDHTYYDNK